MEIRAITNQNFGKIFYTKAAKRAVYEQFHKSKMENDTREYWHDMLEKANESPDFDIYLNNAGEASVVNRHTKQTDSTHYANNHLESLGSAVRYVARATHIHNQKKEIN